MNLNDFVVLPNNKAKSVKLNARNLKEMQMETVALANESKEMEEKLQQLKDSMSKEKEERGLPVLRGHPVILQRQRHSGKLRWTTGQSYSLTAGSKKNHQNKLEKLSTGKLKIRVLKDDPLTVAPQPPAKPAFPSNGLRMSKKNRLKGTICGQCEAKTGGLICAECSENYCIGCFARFHQKGALKLHRMIPIQTDLQTHVNTRDVVCHFQKQINPSSCPSTSARPNPSSSTSPNPTYTTTSRRGNDSPENGTEAEEKHGHYHPDGSQVLIFHHEEEDKVGLMEDNGKGFPSPLLSGEYNEEESARSFQEAVMQWRKEKSNSGGLITANKMWIPFRPVSVSAMATQADLPADRGAEGQRRSWDKARVPVKVEFTENSLTYMDRLLLKKHRRTPVEIYHPPSESGTDSKSQPDANIEEESASSQVDKEDDFRRYCASLLTAPVSKKRTVPQTPTPESCLIIEILDETHRVMEGVCSAGQRTDNKRELPSVQRVSSKEKKHESQTTLSSGGSSKVGHSSLGPARPSRQSRASSRTHQKPHSSKPLTSQTEHLVKPLPPKSKPSPCPTVETPKASKVSVKTPTPKSPRVICSPTIHKSKAISGSPPLSFLPHPQPEIHKYSHSNSSFPVDALDDGDRLPLTEENDSPSSSVSIHLRSTFTVTPSSSTESTLFPKAFHPQKGSGSFSLSEQPQPKAISPPKFCESPRRNLMSTQRSQHFRTDLQLAQLQWPLSPVSVSPNPPLKSLEAQISPMSPVKIPSRSYLSYESHQDAISTYGDDPVFKSSTPISDDHRSTQGSSCIPSSHFSNVIQNPTAVKMEEEEELSEGSEDEMSCDSLALGLLEEDSSDEEAQMQRHLTREKSREEQQNPAISHLEDPFVPVEAETEKDLQTDKPEQLSEPSTVLHSHSAGSGSEPLCDLDGFSPPGLDMNAGHSDIPQREHCDPLHAFQSSLHDSDQLGSDRSGSSSSPRHYTEEHLAFKVMKDNHMQPTEMHNHSARRQGISANELGTSGSKLSGITTPIPSHPPRTNPSHVSPCVSRPLSASPYCPTVDSRVGSALRPLSRAAQEIMEISSVDQTGCEDPDLDTDTTAHTLSGLEQELRLTAKETNNQALLFAMGDNGSQDERGKHCYSPATVREEEDEEEEAVKRDRQSVLLLP